ncbi:bifunctional phosphoribosyl-AMP cyclohydrolase/phosphoribosyl-ATP diphosphatase HisIE [Parapedobacter sp. SGR-10]|uniref:bifunctional phosphoribosyl-AMP cyclohydrolase/phosphoribosyl-ATP diphosphatase HisIE n=1 Tax=Parapedobacter sp. SGR-10 TaxID=2710879 RepID=UPI0013D57BF0|nr:bifunctional phosphoribosyl-AMP cyclohydrolase/phosphoribosyl-ATP diphosphatase HisIE [Parapedobacter sp. SGR-10]NGF57882.1 bifunctional phosphoribosyl-AMP cyclohydrolase/phosphoribosyl-ATP diphosphatase HisIE [Parapedobacter sp. SGR-10]
MIDFGKGDGLVPVIIQDAQTLEVLMLGYMNEAAWQKTQSEGKVTFYSRSKNRLWTKGEESGNFLHVESCHIDCDQDTILILARPEGPTCHTGSRSCFSTGYRHNFLFQLERIVAHRYNFPTDESYVNRLHHRGLNKIAQKVGEEAVETVIAALAQSEQEFIDETSDLFFHILVLLREKGISLETIAKNLEGRHQ